MRGGGAGGSCYRVRWGCGIVLKSGRRGRRGRRAWKTAKKGKMKAGLQSCCLLLEKNRTHYSTVFTYE